MNCIGELGLVTLRYRYRDAANYKFEHQAVLRSAGMNIDEADRRIALSLDAGELFVPEQVGLPPLQSMLVAQFGASGADHAWHEFVDLTPRTTTEPVLTVCASLPEMVRRFEAVVAWRVDTARIYPTLANQ